MFGIRWVVSIISKFGGMIGGFFGFVMVFNISKIIEVGMFDMFGFFGGGGGN